jgi:hypothetical protein
MLLIFLSLIKKITVQTSILWSSPKTSFPPDFNNKTTSVAGNHIYNNLITSLNPNRMFNEVMRGEQGQTKGRTKGRTQGRTQGRTRRFAPTMDDNVGANLRVRPVKCVRPVKYKYDNI